MNSLKKGFTLIELLVVIAILAILATVIVVIINPAELLKQARDTTRISDMAALNSAVALYLADVSTPYLCGASACASLTTKCTVTTTTSPFVGGSCGTVNTTTTVDGNGWVSVNFGSISSGSPLSRLPIDPANTTSFLYAFGANGLNYKLGATMESTKYAGATGVTRNAYDGGSQASWYEVGNSLAL
ncbi:MAG: type II secretion system protein [Candidatus Paceibacterota bacterium]|jgi:prepilin-type N-terminal cleavage/methylation domain-containing protein